MLAVAASGRFLILPMIVSLYLVSDHKPGVLETPPSLQYDVFYSNADEAKNPRIRDNSSGPRYFLADFMAAPSIHLAAVVPAPGGETGAASAFTIHSGDGAVNIVPSESRGG